MYRFYIVCILLLLSATSASAAVPASSINLSVETSAADLSAIVNQSLPQELYKGQGGLGTSVKVLRTGPVAVTANDNFIYLTLPIQLTFSYGFYESYPLRAGLRFKARVNITPDWRLKTELYYTGLSDNLADTLKLGPLSLKPKSMVEGITQPVQRLLAPIIDNKVNDAVQLRAKVAPLWQNAFTPSMINKDFSTWLKLTPERVVISPLQAVNNRISLSIGVITGAAVTVGPKPAATPARPLPPVQQVSTFDKQFNIQLATDIFFEDLVTALNPVLLDKTFGEDKKITIKKFSMKGEEGRLMVNLTSTGEFDGELTVLAKPAYNPQTNSLTFEEVDFDTRHAGWLISAGSWLFSSTIRSTIKEKLDSAIVEQLEKARIKASSTLSSMQLAERVRLSGTVKALSLGEAAVLQDHLSVQVVAQGEASVLLK
ncbi:DUF4403 family protein [Trichlorobacter lovleyi]|uniref:DUF4403 family protein n=1 Tax=Trichlorobacter lovleyi (strain ATCC BAA-1151 / DSM 17278 / SZ) TaxID=398767 RepID=B3E7J3_TRIL1|nr:DUF4403 family protein [Trichlorobacter lovleyi]ACD96510.1 conserved hypothetical protein [Trichlorobacter lovleyi SZ]